MTVRREELATSAEVLKSFVAWGSEWLQEKERREVELNGQLAALVDEGVEALREVVAPDASAAPGPVSPAWWQEWSTRPPDENDPPGPVSIEQPPEPDVKRLLDEATPPDYEAAVDALERLSNAAELLSHHAKHPDDKAHRSWFRSAIGDVDREVNGARAALRRLRDEVPA